MGKKEKGKKQAASNKEQRRDGRGQEQRVQPGLWDRFQARTDLALEERERFPGDGGEVAGVVLKEKERSGGFRLTEVTILDEEGARQMGKPAGVYLTLEAPLFFGREEKQLKAAAGETAALLGRLFSRHGIGKTRAPRLLVVGLGNPEATPDALGPMVLERLTMTRHLFFPGNGGNGEEPQGPMLSGIAPGVMAKTGMETAEIIRGIVRETQPDAVLAVDALAARSAGRLGNTIQLSDTGIHPGSGVGNHRSSLTEETLGVPVFALGAPTVVGAASIVNDTIDAMVAVLKENTSLRDYGKAVEAMEPEKQYQLIREILEPRLGPMYVTPHDIDFRVELLSRVISEGIQKAVFALSGCDEKKKRGIK